MNEWAILLRRLLLLLLFLHYDYNLIVAAAF